MFLSILGVLTGSATGIYLILRYMFPWVWLDMVYKMKSRRTGQLVLEQAAQGRLLIDNFEDHALDKPDKTFIIFKDEKLTYKQTDELANQLCRASLEMGLKQGDIVAMMINNEPAFLWTYIEYNDYLTRNGTGFMKAGIQMAMINFNQRSRSLSHSLNTSGAKAIIVGQGAELVEAVREVLHEIPEVPVYLQGVDEEEVVGTPFFSLKSLMERMTKKKPDKSIRSNVKYTDPNMFIYTSGTTGLPKPAIVTVIRVMRAGFRWMQWGMTENDIVYETLPLYHSAALMLGVSNTMTQGLPKAALVTQFRSLAVGFGWHSFGMTSNDITYCSLPLYHSAALLLGVNNTIAFGATIVLREKFSASHFWEDCRKHDVTIIQYIGEICRYLVARPKDKMDPVNKVRVAFGNGLRADIWKEFQSRFNITNIVEFYGATEGPVGFVNLTNKFGSCGRSSPYMRKTAHAVFIKFDVHTEQPVRDENGKCIPIKCDEVGLLVVPLIEGVTVFHGYRGNKEHTESKILRDVFIKGDCYFNSGDLMRVDKEYYVYFNDRVGDTFRWKGENVSTTEVSNVITDLEFVQDASVYGVQIPGTDGRAGMVSLHLKDHQAEGLSQKMLSDISKHCIQTLPPYARPRFIRVQKEFELTSTYKQLKTTLKEEGYDITKITDPLYYLNLATNSYFPLDHITHTLIMAGKVPF